MDRLDLYSRFICLLGLAFMSVIPLRAAEPLTEQECQKFGQQFSKLCRQGFGSELEELMDYDGLFNNSLNGLELDEAQRRITRDDYNELYQNTWPQTLKLDQSRIFYYSGTLTHDNRQCVVINWAKGINCDLYLVAVARAADGKPKFTDIYNVSDATWESEMRRNQLLMRLPKEVLVRQPADVLRPLRVRSVLREITELIAAGKRDGTADKRDEALEQIEKYSEKFRAQKPVLRIAVILYASVFNKEKFVAEIEHWKKIYPQDLSANLHGYLGYSQLGDQEAATQELQSLKKKAGNNPYLQFLLSYRYFELGNMEEAKKAAKTATTEGIQSDPIINDWYMLLRISAKENDYQETVRLLNNITKAFPSVPIRELVDTEADYQEFRQSDEYRQWIVGTTRTQK